MITDFNIDKNIILKYDYLIITFLSLEMISFYSMDEKEDPCDLCFLLTFGILLGTTLSSLPCNTSHSSLPCLSSLTTCRL